MTAAEPGPRAAANPALRGLSALIDAAGHASVERHDLTQIVKDLHTIEATVRLPIAELLDVIASHLETTPIEPASQNLTTEQGIALQAAGSFVDEMPPFADRASSKTMQRIINMLATALTTDEAAARLGVTCARIRQRLSVGTLLGMKIGAAQRLPSFQFTNDGELPHWAHVAAAIPITAHPVSIAWFMSAAHPDLTVADELLSPTNWLLGGGDPDRVAGLVTTAFEVHAS